MRVTLNLASRPYHELRPLFLRLRALMVVLLVLAAVLGILLKRAQIQAARADAAVHSWTARTHALQQEWQSAQILMREPANAATLSRADFLNNLFARKSFSWTIAMMDLERVLPQGVQVISLDPRVTKEGPVIVRLRVSGPRDKAVELVSNLEKSPHFLHPMVAGETAQVQGQNRAGYRPTMSESTDVNITIFAEFNAGTMAENRAEASAAMHATQGRHAAGTTSPSPAVRRRPRPGGRR
jgi:type IV pilus assembly protein PilN